jgi:hypothetical protein
VASVTTMTRATSRVGEAAVATASNGSCFARSDLGPEALAEEAFAA